jgi:hypothetical protein
MVMAPETTKPRLRKISVVVGSRALGTAWRRSTSASRSPLALAVVRYSSPSSSSSDERMTSAYSAM